METLSLDAEFLPELQVVNLDEVKDISPQELWKIIPTDNAWNTISLNGIQRLTPELAIILSHHRGILSLGGVQSIDYEMALYLSHHRGTLLLPMVKKISGAVAGILAISEGTIVLGLDIEKY